MLFFGLPYSYKFSRIFAQKLDLREIARKLVPKFWNFVAGARKFIRAKIFLLKILKKPIQKSFLANNLREIARKFVPNIVRSFVEGARK